MSTSSTGSTLACLNVLIFPILATVLHTWYSAPHRPVPSSGFWKSIFWWFQRLQGSRLLKGQYYLEIRFVGGSASGRWNSAILWRLSCKWPFWRLRKTWKSGKWHPGCPSSVLWNFGILASIFWLPVPAPQCLFLSSLWCFFAYLTNFSIEFSIFKRFVYVI